MHGEAANHSPTSFQGIYGNISRLYSPVTMSSSWPKLGRLLFLVLCSCLGTTMNGFFVASFFVEETLKKVGNVFLACTGVADIIITTAVIPCAAVVLLSGEWDVVPVCRVLHFLTQTSVYCYSMFFMLVGLETYYRLCRSTADYKTFVSIRVGFLSLFIYGLCLGISGVGVYFSFDYDYCKREHHGNMYFRVATSVIFYVVPFLITAVCLILSSLQVHHRASEQLHYKRSQQYDTDNSTTKLNITVYFVYVVAWIPYLVIIHAYPSTSDANYYNTVWIGICRSVITSFLYGIANRNFRRAFAHLFNYCCCKSTLSSSFTSRHRRALEYKPTGDVRVHIMHQMALPKDRACSSQDPQEL